MTPSEQKVVAHLEAQGKVVIKLTDRGNPDTFVIDRDNAKYIQFVEIKSGNDKVWPHQAEKHEELRARGFPPVLVIYAETMSSPASEFKSERGRLQSERRKAKRAEENRLWDIKHAICSERAKRGWVTHKQRLATERAEELLTVAQVAATLKISPSSVIRRFRGYPGIIGDTVAATQIPRSVLNRWLDGRTVGGAQ